MDRENQTFKFFASVTLKGHQITTYEFNASEDQGLKLMDLIETFYGYSDIEITYVYHEVK